MPVTVNDLTIELNQRLGPFAGLVNLESASAWALREMGFATLNALSVTGDDLAALDDDSINELFDFAQFAAAERVYDNLDPVQLAQLSITENVDDLRRVWRDRVKVLFDRLKTQYGYGLPRLSEGVLSLDFQGEDDRCS